MVLVLKKQVQQFCQFFPLDSFVVSQGGSPALRMEVDDKPEELTETHKEFIEVVKKVSGENWNVGSISRQDFYKEAKKAYCIVTTTDARPFGCFILTKGVILPDGKVWS
jgi:L-fucose mutarotase